jgi:hypothetical protein
MKNQKNEKKQKQVQFFRYTTLFVLCLIAMIVIPYVVCATPPSDMTVSYNLDTQELRVTITHQVSNPETHYIREVQIEKNSVLYNTSLYTSQPDPNSFTYTYQVNATTGDNIDVTATCIQGQSMTITHTIVTNNGESKKSTPGFEVFFMVCAVLLSIYLMRRK